MWHVFPLQSNSLKRKMCGTAFSCLPWFSSIWLFQRHPHLLSFAKCEKVWPRGFHIAVQMEGNMLKLSLISWLSLWNVLHLVVREEGLQHTHFSRHCSACKITFLQIHLIAEKKLWLVGFLGYSMSVFHVFFFQPFLGTTASYLLHITAIWLACISVSLNELFHFM